MTVTKTQLTQQETGRKRYNKHLSKPVAFGVAFF